MYASSFRDGGLLIAIWSLSKPMSDNELPSSSKASLSSLQKREHSSQIGSAHKWEAGVKECQNVCIRFGNQWEVKCTTYEKTRLNIRGFFNPITK